MISARTIAVLTVTAATWLIPVAYAQQDVPQTTASAIQKNGCRCRCALEPAVCEGSGNPSAGR